ncbi:MAG: hypothetical protein HC857_17015, partial [Synechococcales cyanobacterium RU_4_20]|nr:hypothetical protein [Synechococcales cyanobacterium RU_4_20]
MISMLAIATNPPPPIQVRVSGVGGTPPNFKRYWVERLTYQAELGDRLEAHPVTEIVAAGGFGKSSLAAWAYDQFRGEFTKRLWISFAQPKPFERVARWLLQEMGFPNLDPRAVDDTLLDELLYRLKDPNASVKALVVLDQVEAVSHASDWPWFEKFLQDWAEEGQRSRVLVTTRRSVLPQEPIALGGLNGTRREVFLSGRADGGRVCRTRGPG